MLRRTLWLTLTLMASLMTLAAVAACGDDDEVSEEERQQIEQFIRDIAATGPEDVDFFLDRVTDNFLEDFTGFTREECRQPENVEECVGEPSENIRIENLKGRR